MTCDTIWSFSSVTKKQMEPITLRSTKNMNRQAPKNLTDFPSIAFDTVVGRTVIASGDAANKMTLWSYDLHAVMA